MPPCITHPDGEKGARGEAAAGKVDPHCDGGTGGGGGAADGAARRAARLLCGGLALTSRFPKLRASGHACGVSGPLTVLIYLHGLRWLAPGLAVLAAMFWSSITLGRHTLRQLLLGAAAPDVIFLAFAAVGVV